MKAHLEITGGIIRIFQDGVDFGAPYDRAIVLIGDMGVATLKGLHTKGLTTDDARAVRECLLSAGFHEVVWERHRGGKVMAVRADLVSRRTVAKC